jgi:hypothetical protein
MGRSNPGSGSGGHLCMVKDMEGMKTKTTLIILFLASLFWMSCGEKDSPEPTLPTIKVIAIKSITLNNTAFNATLYGTNRQPVIRLQFNEPVMQSTMSNSVRLTDASGTDIPLSIRCKAWIRCCWYSLQHHLAIFQNMC